MSISKILSCFFGTIKADGSSGSGDWSAPGWQWFCERVSRGSDIDLPPCHNGIMLPVHLSEQASAPSPGQRDVKLPDFASRPAESRIQKAGGQQSVGLSAAERWLSVIFFRRANAWPKRKNG